jgi:hypothetical protein
MKRRKGPELKMPDLKAPTILADLYYDLRDRRLLPLVGLVLVAIVATPFLLSQGSDPAESIPVPAAIQALKESGGHRTASLTVVEANPGLRDYRKRLRHRSPLDPFRSFGNPSLEGAQLGGSGEGEGSSSGSSAPVTSTSTTVRKTETTSKSTTTTGESGGGAAPGEIGHPKHATIFAFGIDVSIVHVTRDAEGHKQTDPPETQKKVLPATSLPSPELAVVTYMGLSPTTRKPLFLVSTGVTGMFGEGKCVNGTESCQLIELEPGFPETFEWGEGGELYKINVTNIEYIVTGHASGDEAGHRPK